MTTAIERPILLAGDVPVSDVLRADGSLWSHAATFGEYVYRGEPMAITPEKVDNFIRVFTQGYPTKMPVDYDHGSTSAADGRQPVPKAGDILQLANVKAASDLTPDMLAVVRKAGRTADDPRNLGLWIRWRPTPRALQLLAAHEYSEMSITFFEDYANNRTGESQGPTMISVALTNRPFLDGMASIALMRARQPSGTVDAPRDKQGGMTMKGMAMLSALLRRPVENEDDVAEATKAAIEERDNRINTLSALQAPADGFKALSAELGETDPAKALAKVRDLKAQAMEADRVAKEAKATALSATIDGILRKYEDRVVPAQREFFVASLTRDLSADQKAGETATEKVLGALVPHGLTKQHAAADDGTNPTVALDQKIAARANALMAEDATIKALAATNPQGALLEATLRARRELAA